MTEATSQIKLSDDWHQAEPLAFLVANFRTHVSEYSIFCNEDEAQQHADQQETEADEAGEAADFLVYPLYVGVPINGR